VDEVSGRRVVLRGRSRLNQTLWLAAACVIYLAITAIAWPVLGQRAFETAVDPSGDSPPAISALQTTAMALAAFWLIALIAIAMCWRRRGLMRAAVLAWPLVMLAIPDVIHLLPTIWTWMLCVLVGVVGVAMIAGRAPGID
jgi:hypothetical protein